MSPDRNRELGKTKTVSARGPLDGKQPHCHLDFSPIRLILDFKSPEIQDNSFVLYICSFYSSQYTTHVPFLRKLLKKLYQPKRKIRTNLLRQRSSKKMFDGNVMVNCKLKLLKRKRHNIRKSLKRT